MAKTKSKRSSGPVRVEVRNQDDALLTGDPGDSMWPLTSAGAATVSIGKSKGGARSAHPAVPRTLCDADGNDCDCSGWVAEPMN